jgi:hypothetical protein
LRRHKVELGLIGLVASTLILGCTFGSPDRKPRLPLQTFLLYPNYRGMMFSDQSQVARVAIDVNPLANDNMAELQGVLDVVGPDGKVRLASKSSPAADGSTVLTMDMSSLPPGRYQLQGHLEGPGNKPIFTPSSYTIVKVSAESRASMKVWVDSDNVLHMGGRPRFVIGLYDTTGYGLTPDYYAERLDAIAKAPINLMINYFLADARAEVIYPYTKAMEPFGIFFLATTSALFPEIPRYSAWARTQNIGADQLIAQYATALSEDSRVVGYYTCDECPSMMEPRTLHQYDLIKHSDPASVTFAVENHPNEFQVWRDTVDVLGADPYVFGTRFDENYVGDLTRRAIAAVHGARPVWTVIQFFQTSRLSHFPTEQELHDMSWMAITEGARGVFYWSYGLRGLDWGNPTPALRQERYDELVNVTRGISMLEPVLLAPDSPVLSANSASSTVITKEKDISGGSRYLISYNRSGSSVDASFTLERPAHTISAYGENRLTTLDQGGSRFKDTYAPFQAHIYKID